MSKQIPIAIKKEPHLIEYLLPFFILLSQYQVGVLNISYFLLVIIGVIFTFERALKISFPSYYKLFAIFLFYIIIRDLIRIALGTDNFQTQINRIFEYFVVYIFVFIVCTQNFSEDKLYKVWKIAGVIFAIGLVYQFVQIYFFGKTILPISIIPGYSIRPPELISQSRPSSFFAEPAAFVNAIIPLEFIALKRKDFNWAIFVTISILLSGSTTGVILSILLWTIKLLNNEISLRTRFMMIIIALSMCLLFINLNIFSVSLTKFLDVLNGGSTFGSRILVGFEVVKRQSLIELIFGTNYNDVEHFVTDHIGQFSNSLYVITYWKNDRLFLNTFSRLIFQYGIIGFVLFISPLLLFLKKHNYEAKMLVMITIVALLGQTILLNSYYFMLIVLLLLYRQKTV